MALRGQDLLNLNDPIDPSGVVRRRVLIPESLLGACADVRSTHLCGSQEEDGKRVREVLVVVGARGFEVLEGVDPLQDLERLDLPELAVSGMAEFMSARKKGGIFASRNVRERDPDGSQALRR